MSPHAIAELASGQDGCPCCAKKVLTLTLTIDGISGERSVVEKVCPECLARHPKLPAVCRQFLRIKDVMDIQSKARGRANVSRSRKREEKAAEEIGGGRVRGSGSGIAKGDARNKYYMVEDKGTKAQSYRLERSTIGKAVGQAARTGRKAVVRIGLGDGTELGVMLWSDLREVIREGEAEND